MTDLPAEPGTYVLVLRCTTKGTIRVGRLGMMRLRPGFYVYIGSALGPGGLRARIARHVRRAKRAHWHIDYVRQHLRVDQLWYCCKSTQLEHQWARAVEVAPGAAAPLPGFGASDCDCDSHLFFFKRRPSRASFERSLPNLWHSWVWYHSRRSRSGPNHLQCPI